MGLELICCRILILECGILIPRFESNMAPNCCTAHDWRRDLFNLDLLDEMVLWDYGLVVSVRDDCSIKLL